MKTPTPQSEVPVRPDWAELRGRLRAFVARRVGGDPAVHDDLVQHILLRLHEALPRLRDGDRLDAFAYQVARNAIVDHHRRAPREEPVEPESLDALPAPEDREAGQDAQGGGREELARCLRPLVEGLGDDYRQALLLTDLGELSQAEAARRLGLSAPGMRSRVQRGRAHLREALARCCKVELDASQRIGSVERVGPCAC